MLVLLRLEATKRREAREPAKEPNDIVTMQVLGFSCLHATAKRDKTDQGRLDGGKQGKTVVVRVLRRCEMLGIQGVGLEDRGEVGGLHAEKTPKIALCSGLYLSVCPRRGGKPEDDASEARTPTGREVEEMAGRLRVNDILVK